MAMTDAEQYEFDLNGIIIYRNHLEPALVKKMNQLLDKKFGNEFPWSFQFIEDDPCYMELMENPRTMAILRTMLGDWFRVDHTYGLQMKTDTPFGQDNLHGGPRHDQGEHQYQWSQGRMWNGLVVVMYALEDLNDGDGGFICVPGSHKANVADYFPPVTSHLVRNPSLKAGDMLIFTEALVHGTRKWKSPNRRRALLYKYSPGYSCWAAPDAMQSLLPKATTEMQKALLRVPGVGARSPLPFAT